MLRLSESEPSRLPVGRASVAGFVPSRFGKGRFAATGGEREQDAPWFGLAKAQPRSDRLQNALSDSSPPRSQNVSPPAAMQCKRRFSLATWLFSSPAFPLKLAVQDQRQTERVSASGRVKPAAASSRRSSSAPVGSARHRSPRLVQSLRCTAVRQAVLDGTIETAFQKTPSYRHSGGQDDHRKRAVLLQPASAGQRLAISADCKNRWKLNSTSSARGLSPTPGMERPDSQPRGSLLRANPPCLL